MARGRGRAIAGSRRAHEALGQDPHPAVVVRRSGILCAPSPQSLAMHSALIFALVFVGGFAVMSIEMLAGRVLAPYFGGSIYVWGSVITIFMLALSIGYLLGGRLSLRAPSLRRFGSIFLVCAAAVVPMLLFADPFMEWVFVRVDDPRYGSLIAATVLYFVPTLLMGILSPYAVRLLVQDAHTSGETAGFLYFVSTAGSALGVLLTSFYFVLWWEVSLIMAGLTVALALCGAVAFAMHGRTGASA